MNGKGITLMAIAVVAIGTFALPNTVSLFSGQHTWYDLSGQGNDVPCEKCHADIAAEMDVLEGPHTDETLGRFECEYCHRIFPVWRRNSTFENYTYASGDGTGAPQPGVEAHAASTVACMYCHSGDRSGVVGSVMKEHTAPYFIRDCWSMCHYDPSYTNNRLPHEGAYTNRDDCLRCHGDVHTSTVYYVPPAGGFNLTIDGADTGSNAAHKTFVMNAISNLEMEDANEACIACHTHIAVKINWTHRYSLEFNCTPTLELPPTHFNVTDWSINGTYNVTVYGNGTGGGSTSGWP
ncbi:MAG: hypothetical protein WBC40_04740 [Halobacteriota archaeon]